MMEKKFYNEMETERRDNYETETRAYRTGTQKKKNPAPIIISICAAAIAVSASVFGVFMMNSAKESASQVASIGAKLAQAQGTTAAPQVKAQTATQGSTAAPQVKATQAPTQAPTAAPQVKATESAPKKAEVKPTAAPAATAAPAQKPTEAPAATQPAATEAPKTTDAPGTHHSGVYPTGKGTPMKVEAYGKTAYGYDWTFNGGGGLVKVGCTYTFASSRYEFDIIGIAPGSDTMTLIYRDYNGEPVPMTINFTVDNDLNVTYR